MKTDTSNSVVQKSTVADLIARLKELPQGATVASFVLKFKDNGNFPCKIEYK